MNSMHPSIHRSLSILPAIAALLGASSIGHAGILYSESSSGDLPGDYTAPHSGGSLSIGENLISGSSVSTDRDYISFTVPAGMALSEIKLTHFASTDDRIFAALTSGTTSIDPDPATVQNRVGLLLGYTHPGTANTSALLGTDILDDLAAGPGAAGFSIPLPAGDYTFWIQQTNGQNVDYAFDLTAVPEPADAAWVVAALLAGTAVYRRNSAQKS